MKSFINNKKIIFTILIAFFVLLIIGYYVFFNRNNGLLNDATIEYDEGTNTNEKIIENEKETDSKIYVHITGEVRNSGFIELQEGARIINAIEAAGGATEKADFSKVNLAFVINDGSKIYIPSIDEAQNNQNVVSNESGNNVIVEADSKSSGGKININNASQTELETLTGVGPSTAVKIIEYRNKNGKFKKIEDLKNVSGIGEQKYNGLKDEITVK